MSKLLGIMVLGWLWCTSSYSNIIVQDLINTLFDTNKSKNIKVANTLKAIDINGKSYDLVIRKANLDINDAKNIAKAIKKIQQNNGPKLHTLSLSFNENLKDEGIITLLNHLPLTNSVIAFVECGITDEAGHAIIDWSKKTNNLYGIYIEGNNFSKDMEEKFEKLRSENPSLTVLSKWTSKEFKEIVEKTFN